ncbi:MAG: YdeI/OmpD-associated family protein [Bacteroidota bacterium]|nr:YdeI/OmpD-associated family protein [Bacteroidota bacterium]
MAKESEAVPRIKFRTTILQAKKTATGIKVPDELVEKLGAGKKPPVKVTINGYTYRSSIASMGGVFMVGVSAIVREKSGVKGGDEVEIEIELDTEQREVTLLPEFATALNENAKAKTFFESLSYSSKQRYALPIGEAKTEETKQRRIEKAIADLAAGKK